MIRSGPGLDYGAISGIALVSMAVAIAVGATSMSDITVLAHQAPVLGAAPSDTAVLRTLELADPATLGKIARARAAVRAHVSSLICATPAGFPWLSIAGVPWPMPVRRALAAAVTACVRKEIAHHRYCRANTCDETRQRTPLCLG